jgi:hypothetical protein
MVVFYNQEKEYIRTAEIKPEEFSKIMQEFTKLIPETSVENNVMELGLETLNKHVE